MATSLTPSVQFDFLYPGEIAKEIQYEAIKESIGKYSRTAPSIKALQQWITTNPNDYKGITGNSSKTACAPTRIALSGPLNITPKVEEFEFATETCVKTIVYDTNGDFTHYQDKRNTGMAGFRGMAGFEGIFASNIMIGMAYDNFIRHWFANPANTAGSIVDTVEMTGIWTKLLALSGGAGVPSTGTGVPYQGADIPLSFTPANIITVLDDLIDNSSDVLEGIPETRKKFLMTRKMKQAYEAYLRTIEGSDDNFTFIQEHGSAKRVFYRDIELIKVPGWSESLKATKTSLVNDLGAAVGGTDELILLADTDTIWSLTDDAGDQTRFETNYFAKDKTVLYDGNYMLGSFIIDPSLCSFARQTKV